MKDSYKIWSRLLQRSYSVVSTAPGNLNSRSERNNEDLEGGHISKGPSNESYCKSTFILGLAGLIVIAIGMLVMFVHPYEKIFNWKVLFTEGGEIFELWRAPPVDIYLRVHLFNITNAEEFMSGKEKLRVEEVGPYVYREIMSHENVTFNSNGTLSATPKHPLKWVPELSNGDHEKDQLILPNIALLSIAEVVSKMSIFTRGALNIIISQTDTHPLVKMSPKEFMFGYESTLMTLGYRFLPNWIDFDKLGLIDRMYNFKGDYETVYTGEKDIAKAGLLDTYRGSTKLVQWNGYCGNIQNASDGTKFSGGLDKNETIYFFRKSLCRAKPLVFVNTTVSSGLKGYVYKFEDNALDNGKYLEKNKCFCKKGKCMPPGLLDVHECYYGFPIALSYPHFLDADPSLMEMVDGLQPNRGKHGSYFVLQPESGLPLDLAVRYQINMALSNVDSIVHTGKFSNMVIPMLWTENRLYTLPPNLASRFQLYLNVLPLVVQASLYISFTVGVIFITISLRKFAKSSRFPSNLRWSPPSMTVMERKLSSYASEGRRRMSVKEMDTYYNDLMEPLNQTLDPLEPLKHHIHDEVNDDEDEE
ncbi:SCRB5 [Trypoxylus dichotomus]